MARSRHPGRFLSRRLRPRRHSRMSSNASGPPPSPLRSEESTPLKSSKDIEGSGAQSHGSTDFDAFPSAMNATPTPASLPHNRGRPYMSKFVLSRVKSSKSPFENPLSAVCERDSHVHFQVTWACTSVPRRRLLKACLRIAGGEGFETTVDQTLMRGLDTARPLVRLGPASVSSRASTSRPATESQRGLPLPCLRLRRCADV